MTKVYIATSKWVLETIKYVLLVVAVGVAAKATDSIFIDALYWVAYGAFVVHLFAYIMGPDYSVYFPRLKSSVLGLWIPTALSGLVTVAAWVFINVVIGRVVDEM